MVNFLIFGPPGSGKGTQSIQLGKKFNFIHLSTGDMLRDETDAGSELGKRVESLMKNGELVPDTVVIEMISNRIDQNRDCAGFLFDGFPRTADQAVALDNMLISKGAAVNKMLVLEVDHDELVQRLLSRAEVSGRADDQDRDIIENRISVYKEKTEPVVNYYSEKDKYISVDGMGLISEIFDRLSNVITANL